MKETRLRKLKAAFIFDGNALHRDGVLVVDQDGTVADLLLPAEGARAGSGDRRTAAGAGPRPEAIAGEDQADAGIEYFEGLLTPGFINAHCHLELSHMKGRIPKGGGLVDFILQLQRSRRFPEAGVISAMREAEKEMLAGGIVAVGDIANSGISFPVKRESCLLYQTFLEVFGFDPKKAESILEGALELRSGDASGCPCCIVPHSPYSVSENLFRIIGEQAGPDGAGLLFSVHNQESAHEDPFYRDGTGDLNRLYREFGIDISFYRPYGRSALPTWLPWLGIPEKTLLVHNTYTTSEDVERARELGKPWWCLCPGANMYIESRLPNVPMFIEKGLQLVLGTDSLASNDSLSILEEMKLLAKHFPEIGLEQLLRWATRNGAAFFGWNHLGTFEKGKRPGVNLITGLDGIGFKEDTSVKPLIAAGLPLTP